ncbi:putative secreted protein (Por secretion system target) [Lutibacter sp. Hel_I_33_5]|uniref:Calx-beta domain-containing protein n=1 Tax=Lutibacter sp. Hel_I_33_5 TaxID=1566289 RepID=UPI0011AA5A38|nr:Calx-beta domain-containing protein [Lutibacter sp. Hel_I_33_5]TVZ57231.1 putative secreted protein (Por secretion system target) [Lutibacter sp. Hel_I_33_5]
MNRNTSLCILLLCLFFSNFSFSQIASAQTINYDTADNTNLGTVANDGEGGSTAITGVQIDIIAIDASGNTTGVDLIYNVTDVGFGAKIEEGISIGNDPATATWRGISIKTNDGSEFDFNGFESWEFAGVVTTLNVRGYKNGVATGTGATAITTGNVARKEHPASDFPDADFGDVDEVRIIAATDYHGTFDVFLFGAVAGAGGGGGGGGGGSPTVQFTNTSSSRTENNTDGLGITLELSVPFVSTVTVDYSVSGTATGGGVDHNLANGTATFDAFDTSTTTFAFSIVDDAIFETNETVVVTLSNPVNVTLGTNTIHTHTINDNDTAALTIADVSGNENDGNITVTATLDNAVQGGFTVDVNTADGTATIAGSDYTAVTSQTLTFAGTAGETQTFTITPTADTTVETDEALTVSMNNLAATTLAVTITDTATVTINNDDSSNNAPTITGTTTDTVNEDTTLNLNDDIQVSDANAGDTQTVTIISTNGTVSLGTTGITFGGGGNGSANFTAAGSLTNINTALIAATFSPTANFNGAGSVQIVSNDGTTNSNTLNIAVTVNSVNDVPSFTKGIDYPVNENSGAHTFNGWATSLSKGTSDENGQTLSFNVSNNNNGLFSVQPAIDATGKLTFTTATNQFGVATVTVSISDDGGTANGGVDTSANQTFTITVAEVIALSIADVSGNEDDGNITVTVTLDSAVTGGFTVDVNTADGTATIADSDYTAVTSQTLTFAGTAGETQTFTIAPTADTTVEPNETLTVSMNNFAGSSTYVEAFDTATVTITNDDTATVTIADVSGNENDGNITVTATLDKAVPGGFTVDVNSVDGTATIADNDYTAVTSQTLTFAGTAGETQTFTITPTADTTVEPDETITINQNNLTGTTLGVVITDTATVTITNDDSLPGMTFSLIGSATEVASSAIANISISKVSLLTITVDYTVTGTASAGTDYTLENGTITFNPGENNKAIVISNIVDDAILEEDETVIITLSNAVNANLSGNNEFTYTIIDNDSAAITIADVSGNENDGNITLTATLDNAVQGGFSVDVNTADGTATIVDNDYTAVASETLTFAGTAGETQTFTITPTADTTVEPDETITINQNNLTGTTLGVVITDTATVTITNDDNSPAVIGGVSTGLVTEDSGLTINKALTITDVDTGEDSFKTTPKVNAIYGTFTIDAKGNWSYNLDDTNTTIDALNTGDTKEDKITVESLDGTQQIITITINGIDDITIPIVFAGNVSDIITTSAKLKGIIISNGGSPIIERGFIYYKTSDSSNPIRKTSNATSNPFEETIDNLDPHTAYTFKVFAKNVKGTTESAVETFTTLNTPPAFTSTPILKVSPGETYTYPITTEDADGDAVEVTSQPLPSWLTLSGNGIKGDVTTLAGSTRDFADANGTSAKFSGPNGVVIDAAGTIYVADTSNHRIRKISPSGEVTTLAGSSRGFADGTGTSAQFDTPREVAIDPAGTIYVADAGNHRIRKISPSGEVTTLAGSSLGFADGNGATAKFYSPYGVAVDAAGTVYVADRNNYRIRKISPSGEVTTLAGSTKGFADGNGTSAQFYLPRSVAVDAAGTIYVADTENHRIRKISPSGEVTTFAGSTRGFADANGTSAQFRYPYGVAVDAAGTIYVADNENHRIRKISPSGEVTTLAGSTQGFADANGASAQFRFPIGVAVDAAGTIYVADTNNHRIRKISGGTVLTGTAPNEIGTHTIILTANDDNGGVTKQEFTIKVNTPPAFTSTPILKVSPGETYSYPITTEDLDGDDVTVTATTKPEWLTIIGSSVAGEVTTLAGSSLGFAEGNGATAKFYNPLGVVVDAAGTVYVADTNNHRIRKISPSGEVTTLAGSTSGFADGNGASAQFNFPRGVAIDAAGTIYVADEFNHRIRKISPSGEVTTLAGSTAGFADGNGASAQFNSPYGVAVDAAGTVYVADTNNHRIRKISPSGEVTTLAGSTSGFADGNGASAQFNFPLGVAVNAAGTIYVADEFNHRIRKISPSGEVTTLAGSTSGFADGNGASAQFYSPRGVAIDAVGTLYVADTFNQRIRKISPSGEVTTLAGSTKGFADGNGTSAQFNDPRGVAIDAAGTIYVADTRNERIRKISGGATILKGTAPNEAGTHTLVLTADDDKGGVTKQEFTIMVEENTTSVLDHTNTKIKLYPNPVITSINISARETIQKVFIYNVLGKEIKRFIIKSMSKKIDISDLNPGMYLIKYVVDGKIGVSRFVKQ